MVVKTSPISFLIYIFTFIYLPSIYFSLRHVSPLLGDSYTNAIDSLSTNKPYYSYYISKSRFRCNHYAKLFAEKQVVQKAPTKKKTEGIQYYELIR